MKKLFIILSFFMCILVTSVEASTEVKAPGFTRCTDFNTNVYWKVMNLYV